MYAALWRMLPGRAWLKVLIFVIGAAAILTACVLWIFPWVSDTFVPQDGTLGGGA